MAILLSVGPMTGSHAQSPASTPFIATDAQSDIVAPASNDIVTMLRDEFRVARGDSVRIAAAVLAEAQRQAMSPVLLLAVMSIESGFDRHAVSGAGARGLMQIMPSAHPQLVAHARDLSDPAVNVRIGSAILRDYLDAEGGDLDAALFRYSGGGHGYAHKVVSRMQRFSARLYHVNATPPSSPDQPDGTHVMPVRYELPALPAGCEPNTHATAPERTADCRINTGPA